MKKYDCKNCMHSKKRTVANRGDCIINFEELKYRT